MIKRLVVIIATVIIACMSYTFRVTRVYGTSMEPTLKHNQIVAYSPTGSVYINDIIVFKQEKETMVKRVLAMSGDTVKITQGILYINGTPEHPIRPMDEYFELELTVPSKQLFVIGDNREESKDSRDYGCILESSIKGKVVMK